MSEPQVAFVKLGRIATADALRNPRPGTIYHRNVKLQRDITRVKELLRAQRSDQ